MATDLRVPKFHLPAIPSAKIVQERLDEVESLAKKLRVLLRVATEMEQIDRDEENKKFPCQPMERNAKR
jgi:hypothetical protein